MSGLIRETDRCDRCGAEARVRVVVTASQLPLLFCAHHYAESADGLRPIAAVTDDERAPSASAVSISATVRPHP